MSRHKLLFLCTGNSARSIMGECLLRRKDPARFEVYSAGTEPRGSVHPMTLHVLQESLKIDASDASSKSWQVYADVSFDFVITVCDSARESCPAWPGQPIIAHWGSPDPAAVEGTEEERIRAFRDVCWQIGRRIDLMLNLPIEKLDRMRFEIERATQEIGNQAADLEFHRKSP